MNTTLNFVRGFAWFLGALFAVAFLYPSAEAQVVQSAAGNAAAVTVARDLFRVDLGGGTVAGGAGLFGGVRREINWDGVPDGSSAPNNLPADFFNVNSPRGVVFSTPGTGFQVSANAGVAPIEFDNIDPSYSGDFAPFSAQRLFTALGSNITDVNFFVPGTNVPSLTRGFGVVFSDVDVSDLTTIQLFDAADVSLGTFAAPSASGSELFSFLGISFPDAVISRARITSGNAALAAGLADNQGDPNDLVVMDDFIFGNPVPEPATVSLAAIGTLALLRFARQRRRLSTRAENLAKCQS